MAAPHFSETARLLSNDSLLDFAEGKGWRAAVAKNELWARVRRGEVHDMDFSRARDVLNLA